MNTTEQLKFRAAVTDLKERIEPRITRIAGSIDQIRTIALVNMVLSLITLVGIALLAYLVSE